MGKLIGTGANKKLNLSVILCIVEIICFVMLFYLDKEFIDYGEILQKELDAKK